MSRETAADICICSTAQASIPGSLHLCPVAAVTNGHQLAGLKQDAFIIFSLPADMVSLG